MYQSGISAGYGFHNGSRRSLLSSRARFEFQNSDNDIKQNIKQMQKTKKPKAASMKIDNNVIARKRRERTPGVTELLLLSKPKPSPSVEQSKTEPARKRKKYVKS